jgi:hypothetical protein
MRRANRAEYTFVLGWVLAVELELELRQALSPEATGCAPLPETCALRAVRQFEHHVEASARRAFFFYQLNLALVNFFRLCVWVVWGPVPGARPLPPGRRARRVRRGLRRPARRRFPRRRAKGARRAGLHGAPGRVRRRRLLRRRRGPPHGSAVAAAGPRLPGAAGGVARCPLLECRRHARVVARPYPPPPPPPSPRLPWTPAGPSVSGCCSSTGTTSAAPPPKPSSWHRCAFFI